MNPDSVMSEAGRAVLQEQFGILTTFESRTDIESNPEVVHKMRVSTRKIRAAFKVFGDYYISQTVKHYRQSLRSTAGVLGEVRDHDVLLIHMYAFRTDLAEADKTDFTSILGRLEKERKGKLSSLRAYLSGEEFQSFKADFRTFVHQQGMDVRSEVNESSPVPNLVRHVAPARIMDRLAEVRAYGPHLPDASLRELHNLRIHIKKLRYTIEFFSDVLLEDARECLRDIILLQDHLGELQDTQTAHDLIHRYSDLPESSHQALPPEALPPHKIHQQQLHPVTSLLVRYLEERQTRQRELVNTFTDIWKHFERPEFRLRLSKAFSQL